MSQMTPREIVQELDKHIIGQDQAKRSVAIALRNRWRRMQVDELLRNEITPKNILMMGPTGVGKTEIARRLANLAKAPFIKVEATKFTEVGYVGREVDSIVRDLMDTSVTLTREIEMDKVRHRAEDIAEDARKIYHRFITEYGPFENQVKIFAHRPPALKHIMGMLLEFSEEEILPKRYLEIALVVVSKLNECTYCVAHHGPRMTDVAQVVDGHPADVHADLAVLERHEGLEGALVGVEDLDGVVHGSSRSRRVRRTGRRSASEPPLL